MIMKKKALVAGVLLSIFSMGMSVQAAMTISDAGETVLNESNTHSWDDLESSETDAGLTITGNNNKGIKFDARTASTSATISIPNSSKGLGIYHDTTGSTFFSGDSLTIFGRYVTDGSSGYQAINNKNGFMHFDNEISIDVNANKEAILNKGTLWFTGGLNLERMHDDGVNTNAVIVNHGNMAIDGSDVVISSNYANSSIDSAILDNHGTFVLNSDHVETTGNLWGDIQHNVGAKTEINLTGKTNISDDGNGYNVNFILYGEIKGSDENFKLNIENKYAEWFMGDKQVDDVYGVSLTNGGSIITSFTNWDAASSIWDSNYKNINFINFRSDEKSYVYISTDLKNDVGDRVTLFFDDQIPTLSSLNIGIINKDDNNGVAIKESDGHSVTIARVEGTEKIKLNTYLSFYNHSDEGEIKLMNPIIKEEAFSNMHDMLNGYDYNFVGWKAGGTKTLYKEKDQEPVEPWINHVELDNTLKRINDIRTDPSEVGAWLRGENGKMKIRSYGYKYNLMSGGYDWKYESDAAKMFLGFGISYAKNNCDTGIIGDTKSMGYNLYGSWLGRENNDYVDVIVKYGTLDKKYAGLDDNNVFVTGDYDKKLFSVAAKYGRRITRDDGWYYEPSVGLTWGRIGSADFIDSQGINIHADSSTTKMATLGMQVGKNIQGTEFYGLFQVRHDFDGKMHVSVPGSDLPGSSVYDDMGGTWYKVGIGAARKINKNNSFYMDIEKDFGNKVKKPYAIGAGYRYTF